MLFGSENKGLRMTRMGLVMKRVFTLLAVLLGGFAAAQDVPRVPQVVPVPRPKPVPKEAPPAEPDDPPARDVVDARSGVSFHLPAGWLLERRDGEMSTFRLDARSAPRTAQLRTVAMLNFNPFPLSTFSGAMFYVSLARGGTKAACAAETTAAPEKKMPGATIDDVHFDRGRDEHGKICTEARDVAYTSWRRSGCLRFDLVVNTFCGGEVSGVKDITDAELTSVFGRLEGILQTVKIRK